MKKVKFVKYAQYIILYNNITKNLLTTLSHINDYTINLNGNGPNLFRVIEDRSS